MSPAAPSHLTRLSAFNPALPARRPCSRVIATLPLEVLAHTLIVLNLREPLPRVLSTYWFLNRMGDRLLCRTEHPEACLPLVNFTRDGWRGE